MWYLYSRHDSGRCRSAGAQSHADRSRHSQWPRRQSLSLHRLHEDLRICGSRLPEMRAYVPGYQLTTPASLDDTLALLGDDPGVWRPFAGGTDLMVLLEAGRLPHRNYVNIWPLSELRGIEVTETHVTLGALTTYTDVQAHEVLRSEFPMLCQAASETGGLAIQNRGTLGGNIVNASPAADSPPALLAYDAEIELVSNRGARWLPYDGFHTGYKQMKIGRASCRERV